MVQNRHAVCGSGDIQPRAGFDGGGLRFDFALGIAKFCFRREFNADREPAVAFHIFRPADFHSGFQGFQADFKIDKPQFFLLGMHRDRGLLVHHGNGAFLVVGQKAGSPLHVGMNRDGLRVLLLDFDGLHLREKILCGPGVAELFVADPKLMPGPKDPAMMPMVRGKILGQHFAFEVVKRMHVVRPLVADVL